MQYVSYNLLFVTLGWLKPGAEWALVNYTADYLSLSSAAAAELMQKLHSVQCSRTSIWQGHGIYTV